MSTSRASTAAAPDSITSEKLPSYPKYVTYAARLATFANWESYTGPFSIQELAAAGFFVSNLLKNPKALFCFYCNLFVSERTLRSFGEERPVDCLHENVCCKFASAIAACPKERSVMEGNVVRETATCTSPPPVPPRAPNTRLSKPTLPPTDQRNPAMFASPPAAADTRHSFSTEKMNAVLGPSLDDSWDDITEDVCDESFISSRNWSFGDGPTDPLIRAPNMDTYAARLATFYNWPADNPQDPKTFAKYGMFYTGKEDRTQCHACGVVMWGWEPYKGNRKAPLLAHKKFYRDCKFLQDRTWSDTAAKLNPIGPMIDWDKSDAPHMISETARLSTFKAIPALDEEKTRSMSNAGFYYSPADRMVKCFYCGAAADLADVQLDPWTAHAQASASCTFLNRKKGYLFLRKARRRSESATAVEEGSGDDHDGVDTATTSGGATSGVKGILNRIVSPNVRGQIQRNSRLAFDGVMSFVSMSKSTSEAGASGSAGLGVKERKKSLRDESPFSQLEVSDIEHRPNMTSDPTLVRMTMIKTVISMGFSPKQVDQAMHELATREPPQDPTVEKLVQVILDFTEGETLDASEPFAQQSGTYEQHGVASKSASMTLAAESSSPATERLCVICMENASNIVFVPCGHVKTCGICAKMVESCPMCRHNIQDRIRIYL